MDELKSMDYHGRSVVVHTSYHLKHPYLMHPFKLDLILTEPKMALWTDWSYSPYGLAKLNLTSSGHPELIYHSSIQFGVLGLTVYYTFQ
jgi:hypothetical protein